MNLSNLKPAAGSVKTKKRLGRGQGSGGGGTASRGNKGAKARSGYSSKAGFEGGQMPLYRRVPKFGFININRKEFRGINIEVLQMLAETKGITSFDPEVIYAHGLSQKKDLIKILAKGELKVKLDVKAHAFSSAAAKAIEAIGGTVTKI
ncbi:MAG TPA: 50S ribosomal protein L15 [Bacteroidales bacterium]|nr:50S ribosomal protein L15 [Bacteroidales bacterium]HPS18231.1 50S ribosomal protein L15 [Bacteroidales bacterium]